MFCDSPLWLIASTSAAPSATVIAMAADNALRRHLPFVSECIHSSFLMGRRIAVTGDGSAANYRLISATRPFRSNRIDRESAYVHVSMSPLAYSSFVVSMGCPQIAFTCSVVIPTRGVVAPGVGCEASPGPLDGACTPATGAAADTAPS